MKMGIDYNTEASPEPFDLWGLADAYCNCVELKNFEFKEKHEKSLKDLLLFFLPHGSGIDRTWCIEIIDRETICVHNEYHAMNDAGYYIGWKPFSYTIHRAGSDELEIRGDSEGCRDYLTEIIGYTIHTLDIQYQARRLVHYYPDVVQKVFKLSIDKEDYDNGIRNTH